MKQFTTLTFIAVLLSPLGMASMAAAQETQQTGGVTPSGDAVYSAQVTGANGIIYNCKPDITPVNGIPSRVCVQASGAGGPVWEGGLADGGIAAIGALVLVAAIAGGDDGVGTTTTSTN